MSGQLDEISESIGRLQGQMDGVEKYIHDKRHEDRNLTQQVVAIGTKITTEIAALEARFEVKMQAMSDRLNQVEKSQQRDIGWKEAFAAIFKSPLVAYIVMAAGLLWAKLNGKI